MTDVMLIYGFLSAFQKCCEKWIIPAIFFQEELEQQAASLSSELQETKTT